MRMLRTVFLLPLVTLVVAGSAFAQLSGTYDIGGGNNDYATLTAAITDLYAQGVGAAVTFDVFGGDYDEWANFAGPIPGASAANTVTFLDASGTARINLTAHLGISDGAVNLDSTSYLTWDGIDIYLNQPGDSTYKCIALKNNSSNNIFRNADMRGAGFTASSIKYGVYMWSRSCNNNLFDNLHFHRHNTVFYVTGSATQQHTANIVQNCTIDDVWRGFYLNYVSNFDIRDNDIQINGGGAATARGVEISTLASGAAVNVYDNQFHNVVSTGTVAFIEGGGGAGSILNVHNNFFYDVQTSGAGSLYAIYGSGAGTVNLYFNSFRIGDLPGTGSFYLYYKSTSSNVANIQNNIFYSAETTATTRAFKGLSAGYSPAVLDNNAYYNDGGSAFALYQEGSGTAYATLAALQAGTVFEDFGVEGNPGYTSASDLHILNTNGLVSNNGAPVAGILDDIDGETRNTCVPDIGADEYMYLAPTADYRVRQFIGVQALYPELSIANVSAVVQNIGSAAQANVPVRLFFNGSQADEILVSLAVAECDTITFTWNVPSAPNSGPLEVQTFLAGDANPANDSVFVNVTVVGQPMHGVYDVGGGLNTYPSPAAAVADLILRGVDGAVTFNVFAATYNENVSIPAITGASAVNTITFVEAGALDTPPEIVSATSPALNLNGADYVTFDNIDISLTVTGRAVQVTNDADYNTIRNCAITGATVSGTTNYGVYVVGGGDDHNLLENLTVSGGYYGIRIAGTSGGADVGNEVRNCLVSEAKYGIYLEYQNGARVHNNNVQPGWGSAATEVYGIYAAAHDANDSSYVYANEIHNMRVTSGANAANGIYSSTGATGGRLLAYNNFVYDFQVAGTGAVYGLRVAGGIVEFYFNSVLINEVSTTGGTIGINAFYEAGATTNATLVNNILQVDETTSPARAIYRSAGSLSSNDNCVYNGGANAAYNMGRDNATEFATLALWRAGTGQDLTSVEGNPGFTGLTNLHIQPTFSLVDGIATPITGITTDYDGENRSGTPDIGGDEYNPAGFAHDYGVTGFVGLQAQYTAQLTYTIQAEVHNYGSNNESNVPIVLFYNGVPQDTTPFSLTSGTTDTVDFSWTAPNVGFQAGTFEAQAFLSGDGFADNDSATAAILVIGPPMSGIYALGGGNNDFATFGDAVTSLNYRGIDGEVTFDVFAGTYNENLIFTPITGTSFIDRVIFRRHLNDPVQLTNAVATRVLYFDNADFITFDGIDLTATGATNILAELDNGADYISFLNLAMTGRDSTSTSTRGVKVNLDGNDNCTVDNCVVTGVFYGIRGESGTGQSDNLEVAHCLITGASYGVYLDDMHNARIHDNEIQPHGYASTSAYGVYISSLTAEDSVYVYSNRIHNFRHTSLTGFADVAGVISGPTNVTAYSFIYNNFIYGFATDGPGIYGIRGGSGNNFALHNSIRMNDVNAAAEFAGIYNSTGNMTAVNNIIEMDETADTCYAIWRAGGSLVSTDFQCFYGVAANANFHLGRDGASEFNDLAAWQGMGYDVNSVFGNPGFLSADDLHIDSTFTLCESAGTTIDAMSTDIDGDPRNTPPDIGADEYEGLFPPDPVDDLTVLRDGITNDVILHWSATAHAASYLIYAGITPDFAVEPASQIGTTAATSFAHTGTVGANSKLFYIVIASTAPAGPTD